MRHVLCFFMLALFFASCANKTAAPVRGKFPQRMIGVWRSDITNFANDNRESLLAMLRKRSKSPLSSAQEEELLPQITKAITDSKSILYTITLNADGSASIQDLSPEGKLHTGTWIYSHETYVGTMSTGQSVHELYMDGAELICEFMTEDYGRMKMRQKRVESSPATTVQ